MDRLTVRRSDGRFAIANNDGATPREQTMKIPMVLSRLAAYEDTGLEPETVKEVRDIVLRTGSMDHLLELCKADREGRVVVLDMPSKPLVWGDDDRDTCLCPDCGKDLMGIPYGERMVLQCPECGQYLDATKAITRAEAEAALEGMKNE